VNYPWSSHCAPAHNSFIAWHGFAITLQEKGGVGLGWGSLPSVKRLGIAAIEVQQKCTTSNATGLGLYQCKYHLCSHCRIDGATSSL
jgi:hypothetical protein